MRMNADGQVWKATKFNFICSNHFEYQDYIIPPSSDRTCRLKKYAIPSVFSKLEKPNAMNLSNEERNRLGISRKHPLPRDDSDNLAPATKIFLEHNYARKQPEDQSQKELTNQEEEPEEEPDLKQKLRQKIENLQQKLRRSKKKLENMASLISHLQEKFVISSEQAGILHASI